MFKHYVATLVNNIAVLIGQVAPLVHEPCVVIFDGSIRFCVKDRLALWALLVGSLDVFDLKTAKMENLRELPRFQLRAGEKDRALTVDYIAILIDEVALFRNQVTAKVQLSLRVPFRLAEYELVLWV